MLVHRLLWVKEATLGMSWMIKLNRFCMVNEHIVIICYVVRDNIFELSCISSVTHENRALEHLSPIPWATKANHVVYWCMKVLLIIPILGFLPLESILLSSIASRPAGWIGPLPILRLPRICNFWSVRGLLVLGDRVVLMRREHDRGRLALLSQEIWDPDGSIMSSRLWPGRILEEQLRLPNGCLETQVFLILSFGGVRQLMRLQGVVYIGGACIEGISIGNGWLLDRVINVNLKIRSWTTIWSASGIHWPLVAFHSIRSNRISLRAVCLRYPTNELSAGNPLQKVLADRVGRFPRHLMMYLAVILASVRTAIKVREHTLLARYIFHPLLVLLNQGIRLFGIARWVRSVARDTSIAPLGAVPTTAFLWLGLALRLLGWNRVMQGWGLW